MSQIVRKRMWLLAWLLLVSAPLLTMIMVPVPARGGLKWEAGIALGFAGLSLLVLQFLLTARMRWLTAPFGVDLIYHFHRYLGLVLLSVVIAHPVLLFIHRPDLIADVPGLLAGWPMLSGVLALGLMLLIAITSLWRKRLRLPYNRWRIVHLLLALVSIGLALAHMDGIGYYSSAPVMRSLWALIALSAILVIVVVRIARPWRLSRRPWQIDSITPERGDTWTLTLSPTGHAGIDFLPGQFAWLSLGHSPFIMQEHPFSIASAPRPDDPRLRFAIKALGDFTRTIGSLPPGSKACVDGPYGVFSHSHYPQAAGFVFLGAGIGIAPMLSMLEALSNKGDTRPHYLFTAHSDLNRIPCDQALRAASAGLNLTRITLLEQLPDHTLADRADDNETLVKGWLSREILERHLPEDRRHYHYFLCGPLPMLRAAEGFLHELGAPMRNIHTELFDMA
ncbi:MAG: ferric reductase-like transmembrane domain-containing protein [Pseudohongiellaceae bacterium]